MRYLIYTDGAGSFLRWVGKGMIWESCYKPYPWAVCGWDEDFPPRNYKLVGVNVSFK